MEIVDVVVLSALGLVAGCVNMVAGGGSLLTVPMLIVVGLPADVANATNRLAIAAQSASGTLCFARAGAIDRRALLPVVVTAALGSLGGALAAAAMPAAALEWVLLPVMIVMAAVLLVRPTAVVAPIGSTPRWGERRGLTWAALIAVGLYGGFVQAGVGYLLVAVLSGKIGYPVGPASALKAVASLVFGSVSLAVFAASGLVVWGPAAVLAVSGAVGAALGARLALTAPPRFVRWLLFVGVVATVVAAARR